MEAARVTLARGIHVRAGAFLDDGGSLTESTYRLAYELARDIAHEVSPMHVDVDSPFIGPEGAD